MNNSHSIGLVVFTFILEFSLQLEQENCLALNPFAQYIQGKSKQELVLINLNIMLQMQKHYESKLFVSVGQHMIAMVEDQLDKLI